MTATDDARTDEIRRNRAAFDTALPSLKTDHAGRFALMRGGEVVGIFSTPGDAEVAGRLLYRGEPFSVHHVTDQAPSLV